MSRLPATSAENLANELHRALDVSEGTVADLQQQLEEANATIAAVRRVRDTLTEEADDILVGGEIWTGDAGQRAHYDTRRYAVALLDEVDGL